MSSNEAGAEDLSVEVVAEHLVSGLTDLSARVGFHDLARLANEPLLALTTELERAARRLQAMIVLAEGAVTDRCLGDQRESLARKLGCRDGVELLQQLSQLPWSVLRQRVSFADGTRPMNGYSAGEIPPRFPAIAEAFYAGDLPYDTALLIVKTLENVPGWVDAERVADAERRIVNQAAGYPEGYGLEADAGQAEADADADADADAGARLPVYYDTMRSVCAYWQSVLDQDGPEPEEESLLSRRFFRLGRVSRGLVPVRGALTPEVAALMGNLMAAVNSPKSDTNKVAPELTVASAEAGCDTEAGDGSEAGVAEPVTGAGTGTGTESGAESEAGAGAGAESTEGAAGSGVRFGEYDDLEPEFKDVAGDRRSSGQKMHDALMLIAQIAGRAAETPTLGGAPVTVMIQTTQAQLADSLARDLADAAAAASASVVTGVGAYGLSNSGGAGRAGNAEPIGAAWLHGHDGVPVPVGFSTVRHSICAGATQRVIVNDDGRILGIESPTRTFTPHQRRAIAARDGGCVIPGCTVPATWCEVHHVIEWSRGGPTSTENGVLLCWWHHRSIEVSGWHVRMVDGLPEVMAPKWADPGLEWRPVRPLLAEAMECTTGRSVPGQQKRNRTGPRSPGQADQDRIEPRRADPGRAEPGRAEPAQAEHIRAALGRAEPGRADPGQAIQGLSEVGQVAPVRADAGWVGLGAWDLPPQNA